MAAHLPVGVTDQMLCRVCGEYLEMPGLRLTQRQAQRLWGLDEATCAQLLAYLVEIKFLGPSRTDSYARVADGAERSPQLRMARAQLLRDTEHVAVNRPRIA